MMILDRMLNKPMRFALKTLHTLAGTMILAALTAAIAWLYYISKAVEQDEIGGPDGLGSDGISGTALESSTSMFQATVAGLLFYYIARHHYNSHY